MNKFKLLFFLILFLFKAELFSQEEKWPQTCISGWNSSVRGGGFAYHSPDPLATTSLLLRSIDSAQYVEWTTDVIPAGEGSENVQMVWMFGIDVNPENRHYRLHFNGQEVLSFSNPMIPDKHPWTIEGKNGISLTFRPTLIDKYQDLMGYAVLSVPRPMVKNGERQVIRVSGESAESRTWYMTFEAPVRERTGLRQQEALIKGKGGNNYCILAEIVHLGAPGQVTFRQDSREASSFDLETGYNLYRLLVPESEGTKTKNITIQLPGKEPVQEIIDLKPVRHWTIYLVQHTHTDIGYTRPQTEILPEHLRYIDYALDYCDQTDSLPADARFRWTCETSWAVNEYLKTRPDSQLKRLLKRVKEGRIELTGLYLNSSDLSDEATIAASLQPVKFFRNLGFPVRAAMQDDINGVPWCLADYLGDAGIGLLNMGQNVDRARKPFERPTTFLWESPSGKRIMVNRAEHYMLGNTLGLLSGVESLEKNLFSHLRDIAGKGYPFDEYAIQFSGYFTDNSPPSTTACKVVDDWNRQYIWPALKLATISEFPDTIKKKHFGELPVVCGAWPDWWIDGFGSAPVTTAYTRRAHEDYLVNNALLSFSRLWEDEPTEHMKNLQQQVEQDLAFYDEHTFGAAESITDPLCENSVVQLGEKLSYNWEAVKKSAVLREEVMGLLQSHLPVAPDAPTITVFNTMNFTRSGCTALYADNQILPRDRQFYLEDPDGNIVNVQVNKERPEGNYWMIGVHDILPAGYTSYKVRISKEPVIPKPEQRFHGILENNWYRLEMDMLSGKILSIRDKILKRELIDVNDTHAFGGIIHETLGKNREQVSNGRLEEYSREVWKNIKISTYVNGPLWQSIQLTGQVAGSITEEGIRCEIRLYVNEKKIEFRYSMKMMGITDPEGYYVSFPFAMKNKNQVFYDVAGGVVEAGKDQIPGSATDWQGIQNFVMLRDDSCSITLVSPEIPVVQLGGLNLGKFRSVPEKPAPVVFSWVYNNYWTTNFLASQPGELVWSYDLTSGFYEEKERSRAGSLENASCFAWSQRVPMVARILPATGKAINGQRAARLTMMKPLPGNVLVVDISPAEGKSGIVYHLRETGGNSVLFNASNLLNIPGRKFKFFRQNVLGEQQEPCEKKFLIRPFEEVFILAE